MSPEPTHTGLPAPGDHVAHYAIVRELGRGGMGVVYLARDTKLDRQVAIKFLLNTEPDFVRRFMTEARAMARCSHEHIGMIYAAEEYQGKPYMVLDYHKGRTLRAWLGDRTLPLPPDQAIAMLLPVTRALEYAHGLGIIHRDLKPENIMVTESGVVKVLDFGIAKLLADAYRTTQLDETTPLETSAETQAGLIMGTGPYMSPEQWGCDTVDHRSDLWAAGIMLFEMVVGRHPLAPLSPSALRTVRSLLVPMPSARAADPSLGALADIIDHCLAKWKADRISSAGELRSRLERVRMHDGVIVDCAGAATAGSDRTSSNPASHGASAVELEFAGITLERRQTSWKRIPERPDTSPFSKRCLQYFQLDEAGTTADLPFDVTLINLASRPVTLSHIGIDVVEIHPIFDAETLTFGGSRRVPAARKVEKQDAYVVEGIKILRMLKPYVIPADRKKAIVTVGETVWSELDDPVYLEAGAPYRFGMLVGDVWEHLPTDLIVRLAARTQLGNYYSTPIELSMSR